MKEFRLTSSNCYIRYHDLPGEEIPIVFIHGLGCASSFDYPEVAAQLELSKHRRILVDLLGAGFSDSPEEFGYSVNDHAEALMEFITGLRLQKFILFGHSLGGAVALSLAQKCRGRVAKIILSEANLDSGGGFFSRMIADYKVEDYMAYGWDALIEQQQQSSNQMWAASFSKWYPMAAYRLSKSAVQGETPSWREVLYSLDCPRTFIFGELSLPDSDQELLEKQGIQIEIVPAAGHSMAWENPHGLAIAISNGITD